MFKKITASILSSVIFTHILFAQNIHIQLESLLTAQTPKSFNGTVLISTNSKTTYSALIGYSDLDTKTYIGIRSQFIVGSISKQFTAVLILQEYDKGHLTLHTPLRIYLPGLSQTWADTVTIHQLLTHTHGITDLNQPLAFPAGTQFMYSQLGYDLLAQIAEKTSGQSFALLAAQLFSSCNMKQSFHPANPLYKNLVKGYTESATGILTLESESTSLENYVAAGGFISSAADLVLWNTALHNGKLLKDGTYQLMITQHKNAVRNHPIFGITYYGYGITVDCSDNMIQLGQTGFAPGFASMNFYFPETKTSVVVLENTVWDTNDLKKTFYYHTQIREIVRRELSPDKKYK